jgi:hypothetical protein
LAQRISPETADEAKEKRRLLFEANRKKHYGMAAALATRTADEV